jgi:hypothetical protein
MIIFFFPKKEAKSVALLRRKPLPTRISAKPALGDWGLAPKKLLIYEIVLVVSFSQKKKQKALFCFAKDYPERREQAAEKHL